MKNTEREMLEHLTKDAKNQDAIMRYISALLNERDECINDLKLRIEELIADLI